MAFRYLTMDHPRLHPRVQLSNTNPHAPLSNTAEDGPLLLSSDIVNLFVFHVWSCALPFLILSGLYHGECYNLATPAELVSGCLGHPYCISHCGVTDAFVKALWCGVLVYRENNPTIMTSFGLNMYCGVQQWINGLCLLVRKIRKTDQW